MKDPKGFVLDSLRRRAEKVVKKSPEIPTDVYSLGPKDLHKLFHELRVYQVELEMQNEELRQAQLEVEASRARYFNLFNLAPVGYVALTDTGIIQEANLTLGNLLGLERDRLIGEHFNRLIYKDDQEHYYLQFKELKEEEDPQSLELRMVDQEGHSFWVRLEMTVSREHESPVYRVALVDITKRKQAEAALKESEEQYRTLTEELQDSDRRKDEFIGLLSHEIRNPLSSITMGLALLERVDPAGEKAGQTREVMKRQAGQLARIIDDLLDVSRLKQKKVTLKKERVDLKEVVGRVLESYESMFLDKEIRLEAELTPNPLCVEGDYVRLTQVLGNLIHNALKFSRKGDRVEVSLSRKDSHGVIRIADTGLGLDPKIQSHLFVPFMQAGTSLHHGDGGLGLGLALVKGLIELHGGTVSAYSEGLAKGSEFTVKLPLALKGRDAEAYGKHEEIKLAPKRILVIEDMIDIAEMIRALLEHEGCDVTLAMGGREGIAKAKEIIPEVILCDIGLPDLNGYQVVKTLKALPELKDVFLISLTGYAQFQDRKKARDAGFHLQLAKPVDLPTLQKALNQATNL